MSVTVLTHPACMDHRPPDGREHVERPARLEAARRGLARLGSLVDLQEAQPLASQTLYEVHTPDHVATVERACTQGRFLDPDTFAVPESWEAALGSAGAAVQAGDLASQGQPAMALTRPPGHHATAKQAMGFCLFNNIALAADHLVRQGLDVAIVDIDVHHGNGTHDIFYAREDVLFISLHQSPLYPGSGKLHETGQGPGQGATVNLPVPPGTGHAGWLELLDRVVVPILEVRDPDVLLVSAGYDAHAKDPIGGLELVAPTFHAAIERFTAAVDQVACVLEGGYSLEALEASVPATVAALAGDPEPSHETITEGVRPWRMLASGLEAHVAPHWPIEL